MGYPERLLTTGEKIVREFRPHWRLLVIPFGWTLLLGAAVVLTWVYPPDQEIFDWAVTGAAAVAIFVLGLFPFISWWFTWYILTTERLITRRGVLARKGLEMPLENINDVSFSQTILERVLRSGDLLIESAGEMGQSRFGDIPGPEEFQSLLYRVREDRSKLLSGGGGSESDSVSKLERLAQLYKDGLLDRDEYEAKKQSLLDDD
jgi:membrane protein YdbS with pleckstrin-like domain